MPSFFVEIHMKVDVNYVLWLRREMMKIDQVPLKDIEWYDRENKLEIDPRLLEEWKLIGMSNCSFVECGFYLENPDATWEERDQAWKNKGEKTELGEPLIPCMTTPIEK